MDYEEAGYFNYSNFDEAISPEQSAQGLTHEIIFSIFCTLGVCTNTAIIFTIFNFKRMHTVPNMFLINWAIADLCSLIVTPSGYSIISIILHVSISREFMCSLTHFGAGLHLAEILFVAIVTIDWFLAAHFPKTSENIRLYKKYVIGSIWIFVLLTCGLTTCLCISEEESHFSSFLMMIIFGIIFTTTIALQCSRAIRKYYFKRPMDLDYPSLMLTLTTGFVVSWSLGFFLSLIVGLAGVYHQFITVIAECAIFGDSIINFALLFWLNRDFQVCLLHALGHSDIRYADSVSSFENPIVRRDIVKNKDLVKISFDNQDEILVY